MSAQAVDSFGIHTKASAAALAQAGIVAALRYHYNTSRQEVDALHAAGVGFGLICEFDTQTWHPPLHNPEIGPQHGLTGVKVAQALGMPAGCALSFTQDCYIPPNKREAAVAYWAGAANPVRDAGFRIMGYGDAFLMEMCLAAGAIDLIWQAGADSWSQGTVAPHASLWQRVGSPVYGGVTCDPNTVLKDDCGFWMPNGAQTPTTPTTPTEEPLMVTDDDANKIRTIVAEELAKALPKDPSPFWIGRDEGTGAIYLCKDNVKHHLTTFEQVDAAAAAFGAENRGDQGLALSTLAEV